MIWKVAGYLWPGAGQPRRSTGMFDNVIDGDNISLDELHQCDSDCPLLPSGQCPRSLQSAPGRGTGSVRSKSKGKDRKCFEETKLNAKKTRRQSLASTWSRDSTGPFGTASPKRRLKPVSSLTIDVTSEVTSHAVNSPGLLSTRSTWSTSDLLHTPNNLDLDAMSNRSGSMRSRGLSLYSTDTDLPFSSLGTSSLSNVSGSLGDRMHELVRAFSSRTQRCKEKISQPPTPSSLSSGDARSAISALDEKPQPRNIRLNSFIPLGSRTSDAFSEPGQETFVGVGHCRFKLPKCLKRKMRFPETIEPHSKLYVSWLCVVMIAYMYNATVIPLRAVFPYQTPDNTVYWLIFDYTCDVIYILDILVFKGRLRFTDNGIVETDRRKTKKHYSSKWMFKFDVMSLMPLDLFYILVGINGRSVWLRLPRILKIQTFWEFYERCDQAAKSSAHAVRILKTMTYMLYLIHVETCGYYAVSDYEGIGINRWVYNGKGNAYIRCFYLAAKTATSIGNNPKPTNNLEYMFMTLYWLSGVFVFALLIGQIRDIVEAAGQVKDNYRKKMDAALWYMQSINISHGVRDRVRKWFLYNWEQSKTIDERSLYAALPRKLQADLAINVHFNTLSKVQLFQDCERNLLYDLVLKLKPNVFLPGDFICRKGEVGKEMYIVSQGQVEVLGGENSERVLATLTEGSVFGEISLLAMAGGGNRRTADVRCKGYTNVFTLSKSDFEEAMTEYPEAQKLLKKRAKRLLRENAKLEKKCQKTVAEEIIKAPSETPKMVKTVIQVLNPESAVAQRLGSSLKRSSTTSNGNHLQVPGAQHKTRNIDHAQRNMAFDFSDEQLQPHIKTDFYGDNYKDMDVNENERDEVLVVERIEQAVPDADAVEEKFDAEDTDVSDSETGEKRRYGERSSTVTEPIQSDEEFVDSGVWKDKRGKDVKRKRRKAKKAPGDEGEMVSISVDSQDSGLPIQSTDRLVSREDSRDQFDPVNRIAVQEHQPLQKRHSSPAAAQSAPRASNPDEKADDARWKDGAEGEAGGLTAPERVRKVSTVSLPSFPGMAYEEIADAAPAKRSNDSHHRANVVGLGVAALMGSGPPSLTPIETPTTFSGSAAESFTQFNGVASRKASEESAGLAAIPRENQVTCAVEVHREKTKTPTAMMEQATTASTIACENIAVTPRVSPTPSTTSRTLLPYEYGCMRETIV